MRSSLVERGTIVAAVALSLGGCGAAREPTTSGPTLAAVQVGSFSDAAAPARQTAFSPDGRRLGTTSASGSVTLRTYPELAPYSRFDHPGGATAIAFAPDGRWLASAGYDGVVRLWDLERRKLRGTLTGALGTIWSLDLSPDGRRLAAAGEDGVIRVWSVPEGKPLLRLVGHERNIWEVRFSPDGNRLASGSFDATVRLWDAATGRALRILTEHEQAVVGLAWSPDGRLLATGGDDSVILIRRAADGVPIRRLQVGNHAYKLTFSPDGRWLANAGRARGGLGTFWHQLTGLGDAAEPVRLWRIADGALVDALNHQDDVMDVAFSPDGRSLATSGEDSRVTLWSLRVKPSARSS